MLRVLSLRSVWRIEPWTGALSLDLPTAWSMLERLHPGSDPDAASLLFATFETGAIAGWSRLLAARKTKV